MHSGKIFPPWSRNMYARLCRALSIRVMQALMGPVPVLLPGSGQDFTAEFTASKLRVQSVKLRCCQLLYKTALLIILQCCLHMGEIKLYHFFPLIKPKYPRSGNGNQFQESSRLGNHREKSLRNMHAWEGHKNQATLQDCV